MSRLEYLTMFYYISCSMMHQQTYVKSIATMSNEEWVLNDSPHLRLLAASGKAGGAGSAAMNPGTWMTGLKKPSFMHNRCICLYQIQLPSLDNSLNSKRVLKVVAISDLGKGRPQNSGKSVHCTSFKLGLNISEKLFHFKTWSYKARFSSLPRICQKGQTSAVNARLTQRE